MCPCSQAPWRQRFLIDTSKDYSLDRHTYSPCEIACTGSLPITISQAQLAAFPLGPTGFAMRGEDINQPDANMMKQGHHYQATRVMKQNHRRTLFLSVLCFKKYCTELVSVEIKAYTKDLFGGGRHWVLRRDPIT